MTLTLVEFLQPVWDEGHRDKCLAVLYYKHRYNGVESLTADQIKKALVHNRVPKASGMNVYDVLGKSGALIDTSGVAGTSRLWTLTDAGKAHIRKLMGLPEKDPEIEHDVSSLDKLIAGLSDPVVKAFIMEARTCLQVGALKAAIVFVWAGAVRTLQEEVIAKGISSVNTAILKHDPKAREVKKLDDFQYIKEKVLLLAAEGVGVLDKAQRTTLEESLGLRNKCGHPTRYNPGPNKTKSFIEDVTGIVFP